MTLYELLLGVLAAGTNVDGRMGTNGVPLRAVTPPPLAEGGGVYTHACYSARPCLHVSSLHIHLDIVHNSSSYSLIIIIRSLPRSEGSFHSNIDRRMLATILNQGEQRSWENEYVRVIRSGGPLPTSAGSKTTSE